ncbi:MAG: hypothetical protein WA964_02265 [Ilumatobacter sp.]|uniref:hypothetical protein n=1 Tax=Ilumatobacter sp. TaxID=1967498 RepID=UPI003C73375B
MELAHRHSNAVTRYTALLTRTWDQLSDHQQLDTDRAKRILDLQNQLERLDIRLIADPTDAVVADQLRSVFASIDTAIDSVSDLLDADDTTSAPASAQGS